jgi:hypothetical protein
MAQAEKHRKWYADGLHFECQKCGNCCSGPAEGYIWVTGTEIERIADYLQMTVGELHSRYLRRVRLRTSVIEHESTRDCIFLQGDPARRTCAIYPVRPAQCRSWPFWRENLTDQQAWERASRKCPGINKGRLSRIDEIEQLIATEYRS